LVALAATVYMAHMGAGGMRQVAAVSTQRAHHLARRLCELEGFSLACADAPFLWEFVLCCAGDAGAFAEAMRERGIIAGLPLSRVNGASADQLLVCCTELSSPAAIDRYVAAARELAAPPSRRRA
jgi:glycine dehydrogenase subunit 1